MPHQSAPKLCPLCKGKGPVPYWGKVWRSEDMEVFRCAQCEVLFLWPPMSGETSAEYYHQYPLHLHHRGVAENETPGETFRRRAPIGKYRVGVVEPFLSKDDRVLEVGGGCGNFLVDILETGKISKAVLVESCREHLSFAKETFDIKGYEDLGQVEGHFNKIFLFHILEHITAPALFLEMCARLLSAKGLVMVEVPSSRDPLLSLYECASYKNFYFQPMHPFVHCDRSLQTLFSASGYETVKMIPFQRYPLSNHIQWLSRSIQGGNPELAAMLGAECEALYRKRLEASGFTDTIFGIFRKR